MLGAPTMEALGHLSQGLLAVQNAAPDLSKVLSFQWRGIKDIQNYRGQKLLRGGLKEIELVMCTGWINEHTGYILGVGYLSLPAPNLEERIKACGILAREV